MSEWSEAEADVLRDLIEKGQARTDLENMLRSVGWCVVTTELEHGDVHVYRFDEPAAALEYAAGLKQAFLDDMPEELPGWSVKVYPLLPP